MIDVCFFADEVSKTDFEEAIKLGVEAGANTVEIRGGVWGKHVTEIDDDDVQRVQDVLSTYNVRVASIGSPFGKCAIDDSDRSMINTENTLTAWSRLHMPLIPK